MPDPQIESAWHFRMRALSALIVIELLIFGCAAAMLSLLGTILGSLSTSLFIVGTVVVVIGVFMQRSRIEALDPNDKQTSEFLPVVVLTGGGIAVAASIVLGLIS